MFRAVYCTTILYGVLASVAGFAQSEPATEPSLRFVRGEVRGMQERWGRLHLETTVTATFETRPPLVSVWGPQFWIHSQIPNDALTAVFGKQTAFGIDHPLRPNGTGTFFEYKAGIEKESTFEDRKPVADKWTIIASSNEQAKALVEKVIDSYRQEIGQALEKEHAREADFVPKIEEGQQTIADCEAQIRQLEEECRKLGLANMSDEAIDSSVARFDQEQRLNQVDIAGLEASIAAAKQRAGSSAELAQALGRIQVELEIQLVGKLARKNALARELGDLQAGRAARLRIHDLEDKIVDTKNALAKPQAELASIKDRVDRLENLLHFTVTDNRVTLSPIAQTR